jgi:hypothetical protein
LNNPLRAMVCRSGAEIGPEDAVSGIETGLLSFAARNSGVGVTPFPHVYGDAA